MPSPIITDEYYLQIHTNFTSGNICNVQCRFRHIEQMILCLKVNDLNKLVLIWYLELQSYSYLML